MNNTCKYVRKSDKYFTWTYIGYRLKMMIKNVVTVGCNFQYLLLLLVEKKGMIFSMESLTSKVALRYITPTFQYVQSLDSGTAMLLTFETFRINFIRTKHISDENFHKDRAQGLNLQPIRVM